MIRYKDGKFYSGAKPLLLLGGEIQYFRLDPSDWQDRIDRLKDCGMNTVATYVPWLLHEEEEGDFDFDGRKNPRHNLKCFIELCGKNGLYLFLRPGPFIMAEMKNDGIPFWVYKKCRKAIPRGFDGSASTTPTLDYTEPYFLKAAGAWYREAMTLISAYIPQNGGNVIAVQLDNEIGMLSWVSGKPDFTENNLNNFVSWLKERYKEDELSKRYPFFRKGSINTDIFLSPQPGWDIAFQNDFSCFTRERYAFYVSRLKSYAEEAGVRDILFVINIHGTSYGRGFTYPIGISQLEKTYKNLEDNIISGSDVYFENVEVRNFQDIYLCDQLTAASNPQGKPLACVEFSAGDANFGDDFSGRARASSSDFKTRLAVANGNKLLNVYLFNGGINYRFKKKLNDGNDRIATTGEHHGFASLILPDGKPNQNYPRFSRVMRQISALEDKFADSFIDYDDTAYAFIPCDFATECVYEKSINCMTKKHDLEKNRAGNVWESTVRALLLSGLMLKAVNIERDNLEGINTLLLPSSKYMEESLQIKILDFIRSGGSLLLHGRIPRLNHDGKECTILSEAFETSNFEEQQNYQKNHSIVPQGFLAGGYEYHCNRFETFSVKNAQALLSVYENNKTCAFYKEIGKGKAIVISADYKCFLPQYEKIKTALGIKQKLTHDIQENGIGVFMTLTKNSAGEEFLYLINLDDIDKNFSVYKDGKPIFSRPIHLPSNDALTLPLNVCFSLAKIKSSTVELISFRENVFVFRNTEKGSDITIETEKNIVPAEYLKADQAGKGLWRVLTDNRLLDEEIVVKLG